MPFETVLNTFWVCLALGALGAFAWSERSGHDRSGLSRFWRMTSVVLAVLFLFPCVSESDDLLAFQNLQFPVETRGEAGNRLPQRQPDERPGLHLARFLDSLQAAPIAAAYTLLVSLLCVALVLVPRARLIERCLAALSGRAPPTALAF